MFVRVLTKAGKGGRPLHYASVVRNDRQGGRVAQTTVAYLGAVEEWQIPYLKAAYTDKKNRPKLVYGDGTEFQG